MSYTHCSNLLSLYRFWIRSCVSHFNLNLLCKTLVIKIENARTFNFLNGRIARELKPNLKKKNSVSLKLVYCAIVIVCVTLQWFYLLNFYF